MQRGLILPDCVFGAAARRFTFRPNAYGLEWVPGKEFIEARPAFGGLFGGMLSPDARDYAFVVLDGAPLSPNIKKPFVCLRAPTRDTQGAPRLGLMIEKLVLAYSLHAAEWSPPFNPEVADWLWNHRRQWVPVPQPDMTWARRRQESRAAS
jgi:hypothetical protein